MVFQEIVLNQVAEGIFVLCLGVLMYLLKTSRYLLYEQKNYKVINLFGSHSISACIFEMILRFLSGLVVVLFPKEGNQMHFMKEPLCVDGVVRCRYIYIYQNSHRYIFLFKTVLDIIQIQITFQA